MKYLIHVVVLEEILLKIVEDVFDGRGDIFFFSSLKSFQFYSRISLSTLLDGGSKPWIKCTPGLFLLGDRFACYTSTIGKCHPKNDARKQM